MSDLASLYSLYRVVAATPGCLARRESEVTLDFVAQLIEKATRSGLFLLWQENDMILGAIHAVQDETNDLRHVMSQLTILIDPQHQGQGHGKLLFSQFLTIVQTEFKSVLRVELRARASNWKALKMYSALGFVEEGRFQSRIRMPGGELEDGVPMVWFNPSWQKDFDNSAKALVEKEIETKL